MSGRSGIALPLRHLSQTLRQQRPSTRCLHTQYRPSPSRSLPQTPWRQQHRSASIASNAKSLFRQSPLGVTAAMIAILVSVGGWVYVNYKYQTYIIAAFHKYPEPVAHKLRRALWYTNGDVQPKEAVKYYAQALQVAQQEGMDPFSDEVMGIKIQVAALLEKVSQWPQAVEVLERVRDDNLEWIRRYGEREDVKKTRTRILAKTVAVSVKLGELYGHASIYNRERAEERLVWAVETILKENTRRKSNNVTEEEEGPWVSDSETGATLEMLAHSYEAKEQHYLATPLFLQALNMRPVKTCHSVVLMSNLASSIAQQTPRAARAVQSYSESATISNSSNSAASGPVAAKEQMVENARLWAQKALEIAGTIKGEERDEECDHGCVVAMHNLGEFAEMQKDVAGAKKWYGQAVGLARRMGFAEGAERGQERLKELEGGR